MKIFIRFALLYLLFLNSSFAKDINQINIEGMKIGDSLLKLAAIEDIQNAIMPNYYKSKEYSVVAFDVKGIVANWDQLDISFKTSNPEYKIYEISFSKKVNDMADCLSSRDNILGEYNSILKGLKKKETNQDYPGDSSGNSKMLSITYFFKSSGHLQATCTDISKELETKFYDNLNLQISERKFAIWKLKNLTYN
ncbi:MAG: hypothetical protein ACJZ4H_00210 [Candidatus Pelagibacter sp.]